MRQAPETRENPGTHLYRGGFVGASEIGMEKKGRCTIWPKTISLDGVSAPTNVGLVPFTFSQRNIKEKALFIFPEHYLASTIYPPGTQRHPRLKHPDNLRRCGIPYNLRKVMSEKRRKILTGMGPYMVLADMEERQLHEQTDLRLSTETLRGILAPEIFNQISFHDQPATGKGHSVAEVIEEVIARVGRELATGTGDSSQHTIDVTLQGVGDGDFTVVARIVVTTSQGVQAAAIRAATIKR